MIFPIFVILIAFSPYISSTDFFVTPVESTPCEETTTCLSDDHCTLSCLLDTVAPKFNHTSISIYLGSGTYTLNGYFYVDTTELNLFGPEPSVKGVYEVVFKDSQNICNQAQTINPHGLFTMLDESDILIKNIEFSSMCRTLLSPTDSESFGELGQFEFSNVLIKDIKSDIPFLTYSMAKELTLNNVIVDGADRSIIKNTFVDNKDRFVFFKNVKFQNVDNCFQILSIVNDGPIHMALENVLFDSNDCYGSLIDIQSTYHVVRVILSKLSFMNNNKKTASNLMYFKAKTDLNVSLSDSTFYNNMNLLPLSIVKNIKSGEHSDVISCFATSMTISIQSNIFISNVASPFFTYSGLFNTKLAHMNINHFNNTFKNNYIVSSLMDYGLIYVANNVQIPEMHFPINLNLNRDTYIGNLLKHTNTGSNDDYAVPSFLLIDMDATHISAVNVQSYHNYFENNDILRHYCKNCNNLKMTINDMNAIENRQELLSFGAKTNGFDVVITKSHFTRCGEKSRRFIHANSFTQEGVGPSYLTISDSTFKDIFGGAIQTYNSHLHFDDSSIDGTSSIVDIGGGILFQEDMFSVGMTTFQISGKSSIIGTKAREAGGAIYFVSDVNSNMILSSSTLIENCNAKYGGGVFILSDKEKEVFVDFGGAIISGNIAEEGGGGLYIEHGGKKVKGRSGIINNKAKCGNNELTTPAKMVFDVKSKTPKCIQRNDTKDIVIYDCDFSNVLSFRDEFGTPYTIDSYDDFVLLMKIKEYAIEVQEATFETSNIILQIQGDKVMNYGKATATFQIVEEGEEVDVQIMIINSDGPTPPPPPPPPGGGATWVEYVVFFTIITFTGILIIVFVVTIALLYMWKKGVFHSKKPKGYEHYEKL